MIQAVELPADLPPEEEERRLQVLRRYDILDTPPDGAFDRVTSLAARLFDVPISIVTLVDRDRIWFKSRQGLDVEEIGRDPGLCASAILQNGPWLLPDAKADPRSIANPLVAGEFGLRFYLGVPLRTWDGCNLGTLCVIDRAPRQASDPEIQHLSDLASLVMDQMELRLTARRAVSQRDMLLRELHHRVKNNLQILLTIVSSAERRAKSAETVSFMRSMRGRVLAMGSAHEALRSAQSMANGRTGQLLGNVAETVRAALGADGSFTNEIEDHQVPDEVLLPLALVLNELLTNAFKYGASGESAWISVSFRRRAGDYELMVRDSGPGFALSDAAEQSSGLHFVRGLARQIGGRFDVRNEGGAICSVTFPA